MIIIPPAEEPISLIEVKEHLRVENNEDDRLISNLITAARTQAEAFTQRPLITRTELIYVDSLSPCQEISSNLQSIERVNYYENDSQKELPSVDYRVDNTKIVGRIAESRNGSSWSGLLDASVEYICGYGLAQDVPQAIKQAMLLIIGDWYEMREETLVGVTSKPTGASSALLLNYRISPL
ncbi:MAG: head-tail connector protein [Nitrospinaceae bacterium]